MKQNTDTMNMKQKFIKPAILQEVTLLGDGSILAASIVDSGFVVESTGQDVNNIDASQDWNSKWEW